MILHLGCNFFLIFSSGLEFHEDLHLGTFHDDDDVIVCLVQHLLGGKIFLFQWKTHHACN